MDKLTLVLPRKASSVLIKVGDVTYFDSMFVRRAERKRGYATELHRFAMSYSRTIPEVDIRTQSRVAQRIAASLGYRRVGRSKRYVGCELWKRRSRKRVKSSLRVVARVVYARRDGTTEVLYLGDGARRN